MQRDNELYLYRRTARLHNFLREKHGFSICAGNYLTQDGAKCDLHCVIVETPSQYLEICLHLTMKSVARDKAGSYEEFEEIQKSSQQVMAVVKSQQGNFALVDLTKNSSRCLHIFGSREIPQSRYILLQDE